MTADRLIFRQKATQWWESSVTRVGVAASTSTITEYDLMQLKKQQQREKTRARMARFDSYRQKIKELPDVQKEEALHRARAARAKYRERNRVKLLDNARGKRRAAFEAKHGPQAYEARLEARRQRELEAHERPRCRTRVGATKKSRPPSSPPSQPYPAHHPTNSELIGGSRRPKLDRF
ncbi:hypothetical protein B0H16DRAFT_1715385 [Mycena metata]|uniref:Uncharacterized protein n=1 Tax=Mycena metata TaxID=1033252 RepID=A0AAD7JS06_9AGAR|nr:hypothetical protein B0H16DRAFT_1715385 [Mycena metata]